MPFLKETIDSVLNQTYEPIEIIAVDDGSTDGSYEYLEQLKLPNLILKRNTNKGACSARNYGYELSSGEFIQFLDADDLMSNDKIKAQVELITDKFETIAVCSTKHFYDTIDHGRITDKEFLYTTTDSKSFLLNLYGAHGTHNMVGGSAWLTPRTLIEKAGTWDESLSKDQDGEFFCRVVSKSEGVCYESEVINYYRKHINGDNIANQSKRRHIESQLKALHSKSMQFKGREHSKEFRQAMALQSKVLAINAYPKFKDISKVALKMSHDYGGSDFLPVLGGKIIEFVKHFFGWRSAKKLSYYVHKYILK